MPRELPDELQTLLAKPGGMPFAAYVDLILPNLPSKPFLVLEDGAGDVYYLATQKIKINGVTYRVDLKSVGDILHSVDKQTSRCSINIQNITTEFGARLLGDADALHGASLRVGRWWKSPDSGAEFTQQLFQGVADGASGDERAVVIEALNDIYAILSIGGGRNAERNCQAVYNSPALRASGSTLGAACGYLGAKPTCNYLLDDANGCTGHGIAHRFQGMARTKGQNAIAGAAAIGPQKNYQIIRDDADTTQAMRTAVKFIGATIADDSANDQTVVTLTGMGTCAKFSWAAAVGDEATNLATRRIITFRPEQPGEILGWSLFADAAVDVTVDVQLDAFAGYPVGSGESMPGAGNEPECTAVQKAEGDTTAWTTTLFSGGDVIEVVISAVGATAPQYLGVVLHGLYSSCDNVVVGIWECGQNWTPAAAITENTGGADRPSNLYDAWTQTVATVTGDGQGFSFQMGITTAEALIGPNDLDCPTGTPHVGGYNYVFDGLAMQYAGFAFAAGSNDWEVWEDDSPTGTTGTYTTSTVFRIEITNGGADLVLSVDATPVYTTDLVSLSLTLPAAVRLFALGGAAGAIVEIV